MNLTVDPREAAQAEIRNLRTKITELGEDGIELMLTKARSHYAWTDRPVTEAQLRRL